MSENSILWRLGLTALIKVFNRVRPPRKPPTIAVLVTICAAVVAAGVWLYWRGTYTTEASEWRTVSLHDGSVVRLGPRTEINVEFDRLQRSIRQTSGEASYEVAQDVNRPFIVVCGLATVRAVGTKFAVRCDGEHAKVTVAEGTVSVSRGLNHSGQAPSVDYVLADAGQQVLVNLWTPLTPRPVDLDVALAWERGRIIFTGEPIEQAIAEFNQRHKHQIMIPRVYDPNFKVFGEFDLEHSDEFVKFLKTSPALQPPQ